ncbi:MAG: acyl-ACP--UDP-N-acetylglucosamine O-acyltransferase [Verrucomicrobiae bacterium]|nr:acyl-ACP--UDP-N-acetylglucosamine O-acyltransferase [Verrucomicrobiae bacterium]
MKAHTTAVIDPQAEIAEDVEIGAYSIIDGGAVIESGCHIGSHVHLLGRVHLGRDCRIGPGSIIGADPQAVSFDPTVDSGVWIGPRNNIREYVTIHRSLYAGQQTRMGSDNFLMTGVHLGHDASLGDGNIIANNCLLAGHVSLGNRAFLGGGAVFHQFIRIGDLVMVQGLSAIKQDVAPFTIAAGLNRIAGINSIGLRRANFGRAERNAIKRAYELVFRRGLNLSQALAEAEKSSWDEAANRFFGFFKEKSHRGFCLHSTHDSAEKG